MTDDDKALVERLRANDAAIYLPILGEAAFSIEILSAEIERLREKLIGIRAEIDDMENPFNGGGAPDAEYGFETAVDQAVNIITAALEGEAEDLGPEFEAVWDANRDKLYEDDTK